MLNPGLLGILDPRYYKNLTEMQVIELFLEHHVKNFIARSAGFELAQYQDRLKNLDELKRVFEFDYMAHHFSSAFMTSRAKGLHLTQASDDLALMRQQLGPNTEFGYSAHSYDEALKACDDGADYIVLGAIFPTPKNHAHHPVLGLEVLKEVCKNTTVPVFAIGGIEDKNLKAVQDAGAYGFCALRSIFDSGDVEHNMAKLTILWGHPHP